MAMTNSYRMYNSNFSAVQLGFLNEVGFIAISPVFDKYRGKKPKKGMNMYDHENRVLFYIRQDEAVKLMMNWDKIVSGEETQEIVVDGGNRDMTSKLTVGCGIFEDDTEKRGKNDPLPFQIVIEKFDEYDPEDTDNMEALETYVFQAKADEQEIIVYLFQKWLDLLINYIVSGLVKHISASAGQSDDARFNKFGTNGKRGSGRFNRNNDDDEDDTEEDEDGETTTPRRRFNKGGNGSTLNRRGAKPATRRNISDDDAFGDDDTESFDED